MTFTSTSKIYFAAFCVITDFGHQTDIIVVVMADIFCKAYIVVLLYGSYALIRSLNYELLLP